MLSNRESKFIKSLQLKKFRQIESMFVVEGAKNVLELLQSDLKVESIFVTAEFLAENAPNASLIASCPTVVTENDLIKLGTFSSNNAALAVAHIPKEPVIDYSNTSILVFDRIKDPGNLGTVIRIADWYGFEYIVCSPDSVDCYNAKVISATMGSFTRVKVIYQDLATVLPQSPKVYGTTLQGKGIHQMTFASPAAIVFGNESQGLDENLKKFLHEEVKIPGFGKAESLNVAVSVGIFCDNFKRLTI